MIALIWKELRGLKAFAALIISVELLGMGYTLCTSFPDEKPFDPTEVLHSDHFIPIMLFGLALGAGLLIRDADDGTLHFLDGLPVSRTRIFVAKLIAGFLILATLPVLDFGSDVLFGLLARTSVSPPFPWRFCAYFVALNLVTAAYVLSIAMALSFLRKWFALAVGLIFLGFFWVQAHQAAWIEWLSPKSLEPRGTPSAAQLPYRELAFQGAATAVALVAAWLCFRVLGARSRDMVDRAGRGVRFLLVMARICTPVVWIAAIVMLGRTIDQPPSKDATLGGESAFAKLETKRYEFLFRESQRSYAEPLLSTADKVCDTVSDYFGAPANSDRIVVDLASPVISHALGMTNWSKVRILLAKDESPDMFKRVLGHETAHVIINRIGGSLFVSESRSTRFFNEGMATVVEERFFESSTKTQERRRLTAAVASRGKVSFDLLCDDEALAKKRDPQLVYPLGSGFGRALIQTCGPKSPSRVLAEFNHPRFGSTSHGAALWRDVFQACGFSLDAVVAAYDSEISAIQTEEADFVKTLPRLTATVEPVGDDILLRPKYEGKPPGRLVFCVDHSTILGPDIRWLEIGKDGSAHIPRKELTDPTIRYMAGWVVKGLPWPVFEPWVEEPTPQ